MSHHATVRGTVVYRLGDGPACRVPKGPVEIELSAHDATLSWQSDRVRQSASIPRTDYSILLATRAIVMH